jgi:hypothetical protein
MPIRLLIFLLSVLLPGALPTAGRAQESQGGIGPSVLDGVYTSAQARRGQEQFERNCAACHRQDLGGFSAPPLKGDRFMDQWREFPLAVLFNMMQAQMPLGNPKGLPTSTYLDISATCWKPTVFRPAPPNSLRMLPPQCCWWRPKGPSHCPPVLRPSSRAAWQRKWAADGS